MPVYDYQLLLKRLIEHGVEWYPDQKIVYRDQVEYTYADMYERVRRVAAALQAMNLEPGTKVGVIEWDSHRYLEMYFGIPGAGYVLHTINPRLAPADIGYTIIHAEDEVLIFHEDFLPLVERLAPHLSTVRHYIVITDKDQAPDHPLARTEYESWIHSVQPLPELPDFPETTQATIAYTTGTTGKPKGVFFNHRQLVLHTLVGAATISSLTDYPISKRTVYMPLTPLFHVHAWGVPYMMTMLGVKQVYPGRYEPAMLLKLIVGHKVTFSHCVPTILQMIVGAEAVQGLDLSHWTVVIGGARLTRGLAERARALGINVYAGYGMSETAPILTLAMLKPYMLDWDEDRKLDYLIKTGVPVPLVKLRIVNEKGEDVARDGQEKGEIVVRSPWLTPGYYKDPEKSEELWRDGWLHTGDVAVMDEHGYVQIVDRLKDVIKSGGEWISSLELENLLSLHPAVEEAAVIGVPDPKWGERPLAIVVPRQGQEITAEELQQHLAKYVEDGAITRWAIPDKFEFVDSIPKTSVGKIDKKVLRAQYIKEEA